MANSRADRRALASCVLGHQVKRPWESQFGTGQKPCPSYTSSLSAVPARFRKTKTAPLRGCSRSFWRHTAAKPSIPLRKNRPARSRKAKSGFAEELQHQRISKKARTSAASGTGARSNECVGGRHRLAGGRPLWWRWVGARRGGVTSTNPRVGEGAGSATVAGRAVQRFFKSLPRKRRRLAIWAIGNC